MQVLYSGWTLKWHSRRELWMLENPMGTRWGFSSKEAAVRFAETRGIGFEEVVVTRGGGGGHCSDKTARRRAKLAQKVSETLQ